MKFSKSLLLIGLLTASLTVLLVVRPGSRSRKRDRDGTIDSLAARITNASPKVQKPISALKQSVSVPRAKAQPAMAATLGQFGVWAEKFSKAATEKERGSLLAEGEELAKARREELKKLMQADPALALRQLVPYSLRKRLPDAIKPYLEEPVSGRGKLSLIESTPLPGHEGELAEAWYKAELNRKIYHAYLAGHRPLKTVNGIALVGAAIDDVLALNLTPPVLEQEQVTDLIQDGKIAAESFCSVSGQAVSNPVVADMGGTYRTFCTIRHAQEFQRQYDLAAMSLD